ncbi:MAG: exopolysaccharide biosynthesis protein [Acidobacteriia bacterium]|nr:exopolysaccharide biosynthesis protein [Terriglobia bacterium]
MGARSNPAEDSERSAAKHEGRQKDRICVKGRARLTPELLMIDIHCHPLSGVDDGPRSFEISVEMCRIAAADGITHLVATPHSNYEYPYNAEANRTKLAELQAAIGDVPKLLLGCDFHLSYENIQQAVEGRTQFTINGTHYLLVELGEQFIPEQIDRVFYEIQCADLIPILTHPERHPLLQRRPELLYHWVTRGCLVQVTAKSYTGGFGRRAQRFSEQWLEQNLIHFFASDAHDPRYRPPILSECYRKVEETRGKEVAELLLEENPRAAIEGRPLASTWEPIEPRLLKRKRRWFSFLGG